MRNIADKKISVILTAETDDFQKSMQEAKKTMTSATDGMKKEFDGVNNTTQKTGNVFSRMFGKFKKDSQTATQEFPKGMQEAQNGANTFKSALGSVGKVLGTAFAVSKVIDFGKSAVESAATITAMNAQFSQVFGDLDKQAESSIGKLSKEFNMVPNRVKPAFTTMASQFKGLGVDTQTAMKYAADGTTIAADAVNYAVSI